ncbi:hypothetical protein D3C76_1389100 [compost metagenome]
MPSAAISKSPAYSLPSVNSTRASLPCCSTLTARLLKRATPSGRRLASTSRKSARCTEDCPTPGATLAPM